MRTFAPPLLGCCCGWLRGRLLERAAAADAAALKPALAIGVGLALTIGRVFRRLRSTTEMKRRWLHNCEIVELSKRCLGGGVVGGRGTKRRSVSAG